MLKICVNLKQYEREREREREKYLLIRTNEFFICSNDLPIRPNEEFIFYLAFLRRRTFAIHIRNLQKQILSQLGRSVVELTS